MPARLLKKFERLFDIALRRSRRALMIPRHRFDRARPLLDVAHRIEVTQRRVAIALLQSQNAQIIERLTMARLQT